MTRESSRRVKQILAEAAELAPEERAAYLERVCPEAGVRDQVVSLLSALEGAGEFLSEPTADVRPTTVASPLREGPGTRVGPYKLLQLIGEGGFGAVFMAEQEKPVVRRVALKIIKLGMDTRQVVARFEAERQALAMMDHPNIAKVLDAGATETGRPYFVMELVKGDPIHHYCDKHGLSIVERLDLFLQVCRAVQHAHTKGVIHRDIKPTNVVVSTQDGRAFAKVIDFGIAKATSARLTDKTLFTEHRQLIGTPEYMSPEQAEGSLDIDTRTDIYSLGVLLYELLTGATPFEPERLRSAAFHEMQRIIREVDPPAPSVRLSQNTATLASVAAVRKVDPARLGAMVRGELDWIVMKCIDKERGRRYETATGLAMDVERHLSGEAVVAAPPSAGYRARKFVRKHRAAVIAGTLVAGALLVGIAGMAVGLGQARRARDAEQKQAQNAENARVLAEEARRKTEFEAYVANLYAADASLAAFEMPSARARVGECAEIFRGWEWKYLSMQAQQCDYTLRGHSGPVNVVAWNGTGDRLLTAGSDGTARVWDARTGQELCVMRGDQQVILDAKFSPDGARVATASAGQMARIWDAATGAEIAVLPGHAYGVRSVSFSPDGKRVVTFSSDTARVWDASSGAEMASLVGHDRTLYSARFSPDGVFVLTASDDRTARLWDSRTGRQVREFGGHGSGLYSARFSPDGARVVTVCDDSIARVFDTATGELLNTLKGHTGGLLDAEFSDDGARIVTCSSDRSAKVWDAGRGVCVADLRWHGDLVRGASFVARGSRVLTHSPDRTARLWDAATGVELAVFSGHSDSVQSAAAGPDGTRVATASADGTVRVWNLGAAQLRRLSSPTLAACRSSAVLSEAGERAVVQNRDFTARLFDLRSGKESAILRDAAGDIVHAAFSADGAWVVTASDSGQAQVWDAETGRRAAVMAGASGPVQWASFGPDGSCVVTRSGQGAIDLWDRASGKHLATMCERGGSEPSAVFSPDGTRVLLTNVGGPVRVHDARSGALIGEYGAPGKGMSWGYWAAGGKRFVTHTYNERTLRLCDAATGSVIGSFEIGENADNDTYEVQEDGDRVAVAGPDHAVRIIDALTGREIAACVGHTRPVDSITFNKGGTRLVTTAEDLTTRLWDPATGRQLTSTEYTSDLGGSELKFSPDGTRVFNVGLSQQVSLWDAETGSLLAVLPGRGLREGYYSAFSTFSPDSAVFLACMADHTARIFDRSGVELSVVREALADNPYPEETPFSPDGTMVLLRDKQARGVWSVATGQRLVYPPAGRSFRSVVVSPDSSRVAVLTDKGEASLLSREGKEVASLWGGGGANDGPRFSKDGSVLVAEMLDGSCRAWDGRTGAERAVLRRPSAARRRTVVMSPDTLSVGVAATDDSRVMVFDTLEPMRRVVLRGHAEGVNALAVGEGTRVAITGSSDGTAAIWEARSGRRTAMIAAHAGGVTAVALSPDGERAVTGGADGEVRVWECSTGSPVASLAGVRSPVEFAAWTRDGSRIVTRARGGPVRLWDGRTFVEVGSLRTRDSAGNFTSDDAAPVCIAVSGDGRRIATGLRNGTVRVWDAVSGEAVGVLAGRGGEIECLSFSGDGALIAAAGTDNSATVWNIGGSRPVAVMTGHDGAVQSVGFSPDGMRLITGSRDRTVRLWDVVHQKQLLVLRGHDAAIATAAFVAGGNAVLSVDESGAARVLDTSGSR